MTRRHHSNGHAPSLDDLREQTARAQAEAALGKARAEAALWEDTSHLWPSYADLISPFYQPHDSFGSIWLPLGAGTLYGRQGGRNRPFQWHDVDLDRARSLSRWLATRNPFAIGAVGNLVNYTVKTGFDYEARPGKHFAREPIAVKLASLAQRVIEDFRSLNSLGETVGDEDDHQNENYTGDELTVWADRESAAVADSIIDGEAFLRTFDQGDGTTLVRPVAAEQVRQPPSTGDVLAFGVETDAQDVERVHAYHVTYDGTEYERVPACDVSHLKLNVPRNVKRGLPDFYATSEAFDEVEKLLRAMRRGGAVLASIAYIEQYEAASAGAVGAQIAGLKDLNRPQVQHPVSGRDITYQTFQPGTIVRTGPGKTYEPAPLAANTSNYTTILQASLRALGTRWNMPEYMISGSAENANYSSTLVAGSPFIVAVECRQAMYGRFFLRVLWQALRNACRAGVFKVAGHAFGFRQLSRMVDIVPTPPQVAIANQAEQAQIDHQDMDRGILSIQTRRARRGLDDDTEDANLKKKPITRQPGKVTDIDAAGNPIGRPDQNQPPPRPPAGPSTGVESVREATGGDEGEDMDERAGLIADVLYGLYGDQALAMLAAGQEHAPEVATAESIDLAEAWNPIHHPRGKGGRFIARGSAEAVSTAQEAIGRVLKGDKSPHGVEQMMQHLHILTVAQLRDLHREHGVKAPGHLREHLVESVKARLEASATGKPEPAQKAPEVKPEEAKPAPAVTVPGAGGQADAVAVEADIVRHAQPDPTTGLSMLVPKMFDTLRQSHPNLTREQFSDILHDMQAGDRATLQLFGDQGNTRAATGYDLADFPQKRAALHQQRQGMTHAGPIGWVQVRPQAPGKTATAPHLFPAGEPTDINDLFSGPTVVRWDQAKAQPQPAELEPLILRLLPADWKAFAGTHGAFRAKTRQQAARILSGRLVDNLGAYQRGLESVAFDPAEVETALQESRRVEQAWDVLVEAVGLEALLSEEDLVEAAEHKPGDVWKGPSGRWFTKRPDGRTVPARAPGGQAAGKEKAGKAKPEGKPGKGKDVATGILDAALKAGAGDNPVSIPDLRASLPEVDRQAFDAAVLALADQDRVALIPDNRAGQLSAAELATLVHDPSSGMYFRHIGVREPEAGAIGKPEKKPAGKAAQKPTVDEVHEKAKALLADPSKLTPESGGELASAMLGMNRNQLNDIKKRLGIVAGGKNVEVAKKVADQVIGRAKAGEKAPSKEKKPRKKPAEKPVAKALSPEEAGQVALGLAAQAPVASIPELRDALAKQGVTGKDFEDALFDLHDKGLIFFSGDKPPEQAHPGDLRSGRQVLGTLMLTARGQAALKAGAGKPPEAKPAPEHLAALATALEAHPSAKYNAVDVADLQQALGHKDPKQTLALVNHLRDLGVLTGQRYEGRYALTPAQQAVKAAQGSDSNPVGMVGVADQAAFNRLLAGR